MSKHHINTQCIHGPQKANDPHGVLLLLSFQTLWELIKKMLTGSYTRLRMLYFQSTIQLTENNEEVELYWIQEKAKKIKGKIRVQV